jgi:predicted lysophospholipase L1 biosynthesis ABC-type transport system permease subunit
MPNSQTVNLISPAKPASARRKAFALFTLTTAWIVVGTLLGGWLFQNMLIPFIQNQLPSHSPLNPWVMSIATVLMTAAWLEIYYQIHRHLYPE